MTNFMALSLIQAGQGWQWQWIEFQREPPRINSYWADLIVGWIQE